jgi:hypothetical protein
MICVKLFAAGCLCSLSTLLPAQDLICTETEMLQGKVTDLSFSKVTYTPSEDSSKSLQVPMSKVLLLFNAGGAYLVPHRLDSADSHARGCLISFFTNADAGRSKDQVITLKHNVMEVTITREDDEYVYWADDGVMAKKDIAAIIYSNGSPKIFSPMEQAAAALGACHNTLLNLGAGSEMASATTDDPPPNTTSSTTNATATTSQGASSTSGTSGATTTDTKRHSSGNAPILAATGDDSAARAKVDSLLGGRHITRQEFADKCEQKTRMFTDYLGILCKRDAPNDELNKATDGAVALFVNEDATVEVSSNNRNNISRWKIRTYLGRLKLVPYDHIEVKWVNVQYVDDLKLGPDGNLHGTVSFEQVFRAYKDNELVYSDVTIKTANILLKMYKFSSEGSTGNNWDVLLSDVGVNATKSL